MKLLLIFCTIFSLHAQSSTILFIGDSHSVGPFGWALDEHLRSDGHAVATYASCGSIPKWWTTGQKTPCGYFSRDLNGNKVEAKTHPTPLIKNLLETIKPETVVMEFGGNYLLTPSAEFIKSDIRSIVKTVKDSGARCFWITHPDSRSNRSQIPRVAALIKEAVGEECPVFESHKVTRYPETGGDGTHYWFKEALPLARAWAKSAYEAFKLTN